MPNSNNVDLSLLWIQMGEMEQVVWATAFSLHTSSAEEAAKLADEAVERLRTLDDSRSEFPEPEYVAARAGICIELRDFETWYCVEMQIRYGKKTSYRPPSKEDCAEAYERYRMSTSDFY